MKLPFGLTVKEIKGRKYLYFWFYDLQTDKRKDRYLGPVGQKETYLASIKAKLVFMVALRKELDVAILKAEQEVAQSPAELQPKKVL